jgi:hypothetical protein
MKTNLLGRAIILAVLLVALAGAPSALAGKASVTVSPTQITDHGEEATFTINLSSPAPRKIAIKFALSGNSVAGRDYALFGDLKNGRIIIQPGQSFATVTLHTFDGDGPAFEFATLHIIGGEKYSVGSPSHATVRIENIR